MRLFSIVYFRMSPQIACLRGSIITVHTGYIDATFLPVYFQMSPQTDCVIWCKITQVAFDCLFPTMGFQMFPKMAGMGWSWHHSPGHLAVGAPNGGTQNCPDGLRLEQKHGKAWHRSLGRLPPPTQPYMEVAQINNLKKISVQWFSQAVNNMDLRDANTSENTTCRGRAFH